MLVVTAPLLPTKNKNTLLLHVNGIKLTEDKEKAEAFSHNFHNEEGKESSNQAESFNAASLADGPLNLTINEPFNIQELEKALNNSKSSAPGTDQIPYDIYKNLPKTSKQLLLKVMNMIWNTGDIPRVCKHAILIPIVKPNKDPHNVKSYRPTVKARS